MDIRTLLQKAIERTDPDPRKGSQRKLAKATGYTPNAINHALKIGRVSPRMAARIQKAVGISAARLCPDELDGLASE
jgi:plasmid maintenance system antidote protein VapI